MYGCTLILMFVFFFFFFWGGGGGGAVCLKFQFVVRLVGKTEDETDSYSHSSFVFHLFSKYMYALVCKSTWEYMCI